MKDFDPIQVNEYLKVYPTEHHIAIEVRETDDISLSFHVQQKDVLRLMIWLDVLNKKRIKKYNVSYEDLELGVYSGEDLGLPMFSLGISENEEWVEEYLNWTSKKILKQLTVKKILSWFPKWWE